MLKRSSEEIDLPLHQKPRIDLELEPTIENLKIKIKELEQDLKIKNELIKEFEISKHESLSKQISKNRIYIFLKNILKQEVSDKVLIDITFTEDENEMTVLGRPSVLGSARKQMRHVTPFSFVEQMLKSQLKNTILAATLLESLSWNLIMLLNKEQGICLTQEEYDKLGLTEEQYKIKMHTSKGSKKNIYYLFSDKEYKEIQTNIIEMGEDNEKRAIELYRPKKNKFIKNSMKTLQEAISDENTLQDLF